MYTGRKARPAAIATTSAKEPQHGYICRLDEQFSSDEEAHAEFKRTVAAEGMQTFLDRGNVIPFNR